MGKPLVETQALTKEKLMPLTCVRIVDQVALTYKGTDRHTNAVRSSSPAL